MLTLSSIMSDFSILFLLLGLGFIIFIHELGHFLVAKAVGIRCTQFAIGFGKALLCWRKGVGLRVGSTEPELEKRLLEYFKQNNIYPAKKATAESDKSDKSDESDKSDDSAEQEGPMFTQKQIDDGIDALGLGETEYRLNFIPLGGYVKMLGQEDLDPGAISEDPRSFNKKPIWARSAVISAGVIMNLIFGLLFFVICFKMGVNFPPAEIDHIVTDSPAYKTAAEGHPELVGLKPGDKILAVNGKKPSDFADIKIASALAGPEDIIVFDIERTGQDGKPIQLTYKLTPEKDDIYNLLHIGLAAPTSTQLADPKKKKEIAKLQKELDKFNLTPGAKLIAINDQKIDHYWQYLHALDASNGNDLTLTFKAKDNTEIKTTITPKTERSYIVKAAEGPDKKKQLIFHLAGLIPPIKIVDVLEGPATDKLFKDDIVAAVNDIKWPTVAQFIEATKQSGGKEMTLSVMRKGEMKTVKVKPDIALFGLFKSKPKFNIQLGDMLDSNMIATILPDSPFAQLNLPGGTQLLSINGKKTANYADIRRALEIAGDKPIALECKIPLAGGKIEQKTITLNKQTQTEIAKFGWADPIGYFKQLKVTQKAETTAQAVTLGFDKTTLFLKQTYITIMRLFQGTVKVEHLQGPIGITVAGSSFAAGGMAYLLFFLGLLSVNLAVINFLPLPIVDGGLFLMLMYEKLTGKPVPVKFQSAITVTGLVLLATIFLMVTFHDISRLFNG